MAFWVLGVNHHTAAIDVREKLAFSPGELRGALSEIEQKGFASEIAVMSTCNRTEFYCESDDDIEALKRWWAARKHIDIDQVSGVVYQHRHEHALRHLMKVASGLDSLVLGEPQILGQLKSSYALADEHGFLGSTLYSAFQQAFAVAKRVRTETAIGENPVSVAYAAVRLAKQIFSDLSSLSVMLVGAGDTTELVARHLREQGVTQVMVANRTLEHASELASLFDGEGILLGSIPDYLSRADILISSTASQLPLIGKGMVEKALKQRKHKPVFMLDIAVPRDIEPQVAELSDVFLYTVDDLGDVINENKRSRQEAANIANDIIEQGLAKYRQTLEEQGVVDVVRLFREQMSELTEAELEKAKNQLAAGHDAEDVLAKFAHSLSRKFMHGPSSAIKSAPTKQHGAMREALQTLFSLGKSNEQGKYK